MTSNLKHELIYLIRIFNASTKLTCYDPKPEIVNIMDTAYYNLTPYRRYWTMINPKIGFIELKKEV